MSVPIFLDPVTVAQTATEGGLDQQTITPLIVLAQRIGNEPQLQHCAIALHAQVYEQSSAAVNPTADECFGTEVNKLYLLLAVDAVRLLRTVHETRGIPAAVTQESYGALPMSAQRYAQWHNGAVGMEEWVFRHWFGGVVATGNLYRLGRMEFILQEFDGDLRLYRHKASGRLQAVAEAGIGFTAEGYRPFTYQERLYQHYGWAVPQEDASGWTAELHEEEGLIRGTPISPLGYATRQPVELAKAEWELILRNGDTVLDMHIPNFMPLKLDLLKESLQRALDFFPRYHPERPFQSFACSSWIFNTQWVEMLQPSSNLLAFQRQGYLFPLASGGAGAMYFLFGNQLLDLATAPRDTTLRRAVLDHLQAGGQLRDGGFLLLPEDVARFGEDPYR